MVDWGSVDATPRIDAAGWYLMDITAESGSNSAGPYLQLNMACAEGSFKGAKMKDWLKWHTPGQVKRTAICMQRMGRPVADDSDLTPEAFGEVRCYVELKWGEDYKSGDQRLSVSYSGYRQEADGPGDAPAQAKPAEAAPTEDDLDSMVPF